MRRSTERVSTLTQPPAWHEIMDCVLSLAVGAALADSIDPERRNLMKPVRGEALIEGQIDHAEVSAIRELFGAISSDAKFIAVVDEGIAAYTKKNRHPTNVCKYLALACSEQQKLALITLLIHLSQADGEIGPREAWYIERAGFVIEVPDDQMPDIAGAGGPVSSTAPLGANLSGHCGLLGVKPPTTVAAIKAAYRAMAMKNHPDTLVATGVSWEEANRRFRDVRRSYEALLQAADAGLLGVPARRQTKKDLDSLVEAARAFWSGFPATTWTSPAKTIEELRGDSPEAARPGAGRPESAGTAASGMVPTPPPMSPTTPALWQTLLLLPVGFIIVGALWFVGLLLALMMVGMIGGKTAFESRPGLSLFVFLGVLLPSLAAGTYGGLKLAFRLVVGRGPDIGPDDAGVGPGQPNEREPVAERRGGLLPAIRAGFEGFIGALIIVAIGTGIASACGVTEESGFGRFLMVVAVMFLILAVFGSLGQARLAFSGQLDTNPAAPGTLGCANCDSPIPDEGLFCPRCGAGQSRTCRSCSAPLVSDARFCGRCGTSAVGSDSKRGG